MSKKFVLVVDAQGDFMDASGALYVPGAAELRPAVDYYLKELDSSVLGVLYTQDTHDPLSYPPSEEGQVFPPHCYEGTPGWEFAVTTDVVPKTYFLKKDVFDMWADPVGLVEFTNASGGPKKNERDVFFSNLKLQGVDTIDVLGFASDYCVKWAVEGLLERGFKVRILRGLTAGIERDIETVLSEDWKDKEVELV